MYKAAIVCSLFLLGSAACNNTPTNPSNPEEEAEAPPEEMMPVNPPDPNEIGAAGGSITEKGVTVTLPAGAVTESVIITVASGTRVARNQHAEAGLPFLFGPAGQKFLVPVTVTLPFDVTKLAGKTSADIVVLHRDDVSGAISAIAPVQVDDVAHTVKVVLSSFSTLQAAVPATVDGAQSSIVITPSGPLADGQQQATIVVSAKNTSGEPYPGLSVSLAVSGAQTSLAQPSATTNFDGQTSGTLSATVAGVKTVSATIAGVAVSTTQDVTFASATAASVRITSPLPFERVPQDTTLTITWTSTNVSETVVLSVSTDGGVTYAPIASSLPSTGSTTWTPPADKPRARLRLTTTSQSAQDVQGADFRYAKVWFVKGGVFGSGSSWTDAVSNFSQLQGAQPGDMVWVANTADAFSNTAWRGGIDVYGGFNGTETALSQRVFPLALSHVGGRLTVAGNGRPLTVQGIHFKNGNRALHLSGGGDVDVGHCGFANNTSSDAGGAVFISGVNAKIHDCSFTGNNSSMAGGALVVDAGEQYQPMVNVEIKDCLFQDNGAPNGGAVAVLGFSSLSAIPDVRIIGSRFLENTASANGGALFAINSTPTVEGSTFEANVASRNGGAFYSLHGRPHVTRSTFTNNSALVNADLEDATTNVSKAVFGGGAIMLERGDGGLIERSLFTGNLSAAGGGAIAVKQRPDNGHAAPQIVNCVFSGNQSTYVGGAAFVGAEGRASFRFNTVFDNTAAIGGAFGTMDETSTTIDSSILYQNMSSLQSFDGADLSSLFTVSTSNILPVYASVMSVDPSFVNAASGDFHLAAGSQCINAGNATGAPTVDFDGKERDAMPDMGAFEL